MNSSDFSFKKHPYFRNGIQIRAELPNKNGISIINGNGAYCDNNTYEIAPLYDGELMDIEAWGDQVRGYVTPQEIDVIIEHMYNDTPEEYKEFLENFEFSGKEVSVGEIFTSILETMKKVAEQ